MNQCEKKLMLKLFNNISKDKVFRPLLILYFYVCCELGDSDYFWDSVDILTLAFSICWQRDGVTVVVIPLKKLPVYTYHSTAQETEIHCPHFPNVPEHIMAGVVGSLCAIYTVPGPGQYKVNYFWTLRGQASSARIGAVKRQSIRPMSGSQNATQFAQC